MQIKLEKRFNLINCGLACTHLNISCRLYANDWREGNLLLCRVTNSWCHSCQLTLLQISRSGSKSNWLWEFVCSGRRHSTFQVCAPVILKTSCVCAYGQGDFHLVCYSWFLKENMEEERQRERDCFFLPRILHSVQWSDILCIPDPGKQLRYPSPEEKKERRLFVAVSNLGGERNSLQIAQRDRKRETISAERVFSK